MCTNVVVMPPMSLMDKYVVFGQYILFDPNSELELNAAESGVCVKGFPQDSGLAL